MTLLATAWDLPDAAFRRLERVKAQARLVGRTGERARIVEHLSGSERRSAVLVGPAGVGKSMLARACLEDLADTDVNVVHVVASPATRDLPLGALSRLLPDAQPIPQQGVHALRAATDAIVKAAPSPLLLSIDDAHDLDPQSAWVVRDLVANGAVTVLATIRSGERCPDEITALWTEGLAERVDIEHFDRVTSDAFTDHVLGGRAHPSLHERVWGVSQGNALYLREILLGARQAGTIERLDGMWALVEPLSPSDRLVEVIERRLRDLDDERRDALGTLAVAGTLGVEMAESLIPGDVLVDLERFGHVQVETDGDRDHLRLAHPLHAEALRAAMPLSRYRQVCRRLAAALAETGLQRKGDALRLATWQLAGGAVDPDLFTAAADAARFAGDHDLAARLARAAWDNGRVFAAVAVLIAVLGFQGRHEEAASWAGSIDLDELTEEQRTQLEILRAETFFWGLGRGDDARAVIHGALQVIEHPDRRNELLAARAAYDMLAGRVHEALATTHELALGESSRTVAATALSSAGSLVLVGRPVEAWEVAQRGIDARLAEEDSPLTIEFGLLVVAQVMAATTSGRFEEGEALGRMAHQIAVEANTPLGQGFLGMVLGRLLLQRGQAAEADRWLHDAHLRFGEGGYEGAQRWCLGARVFTRAYQGDGVGAAELVGASKQLRDRELLMMEPEMRRGQAWAAAAAGDRPAAVDLLASAIEAGVEMAMPSHEIAARHDLVRLGVHDQENEDRLTALGDLVEGPLSTAQAQHARALAASDDGAALAAVGEAYAALDAELFAAEAFAQAASRAHRFGDGRAATGHERRATELQRRCGDVRTPALSGLASGQQWRLTPRERDVATLAAQGLATKAIAERLVVSPRTVDNHLHRLYAKLGIAGKDELPTALGTVD